MGRNKKAFSYTALQEENVSQKHQGKLSFVNLQRRDRALHQWQGVKDGQNWLSQLGHILLVQAHGFPDNSEILWTRKTTERVSIVA